MRRLSLAIKHFCEEQNVTSADALIIACSGGPDSYALALGLADYAHRQNIDCYALSVDHGIRPESCHEAQQVAALLNRWGVRVQTHHFPAQQWHNPSDSGGPEDHARKLRYQALQLLALTCQRRGYRRVLIALGHTADDQAETVLLRLARGSGVGSLSAIRAIRPCSGSDSIFLIRPLLDVRRADTHEVCEIAQLPVIHDPSNELDSMWTTSDGRPLLRTAVRHLALPALHQALGGDPTEALARTAQLSALDDEALHHYAERAYNEARDNDETTPGCLVMNIPALSEHPAAVRLRVIHAAAITMGASQSALNSGHLKNVDRLITHWKGQVELHLPQIRVVRKNTKLYFVPTKAIS